MSLRMKKLTWGTVLGLVALAALSACTTYTATTVTEDGKRAYISYARSFQGGVDVCDVDANGAFANCQSAK